MIPPWGADTVALPLGAGVAVPEGAPRSGEAEPAPKGRRIFSNSEMDGVRGKIAGWIKELM